MLDAASSSGMFVSNKQTRKTMERHLLLTAVLNVGTSLKPEIFTANYAVLKTDRFEKMHQDV